MDILKRKSSLFLSMGSEEPRYALRCGLQTRARLWNRLQAGFLSVTSSQGALGGDEPRTLSAFGRPVGTHRQYAHTQWGDGWGQLLRGQSGFSAGPTIQHRLNTGVQCLTPQELCELRSGRGYLDGPWETSKEPASNKSWQEQLKTWSRQWQGRKTNPTEK